MRILHVYKLYYPDSFGGVEENIRQISRITQQFGYEHRVYSLSPNPIPDVIVNKEITIFRSKYFANVKSTPLGGFDAFAKFAELSTWADVVAYHYPWPFMDLLMFVQADRPAYLFYQCEITRQRILKYLYAPLRRITFSKTRRIAVSNPNILQTSNILQRYQDKVSIIPLSISENSTVPDDIWFDSLGIKQPFILFFGVLRYYKGLSYLISAGADVNADIVIAGDGPERENLMAQTDDLNLKTVHFIGRVNDSQKKTLYQKCSVFAFPSCYRSESYGMALAEASMYGKAMVSCEIGTGTSWINKDGETGFVVPPKDSKALGKALKTLIKDRVLCEKLGKSARKRYEEYLSPDRHAENIRKFFEDF